MKKATSYLFLAKGFEEVEALATVDIMRRADMDVRTVSITSSLDVQGAHGVTVRADTTIDDCMPALADALWLILPGGMPGASNLVSSPKVCAALSAHNARGGRIAAICASPAVVLAPLGLLKGHKATCYPGFEAAMKGATLGDTPVVVDDNIVTANGPAAASMFGLTIVGRTLGEDAARQVAAGMLIIQTAHCSEYYF